MALLNGNGREETDIGGRPKERPRVESVVRKALKQGTGGGFLKKKGEERWVNMYDQRGRKKTGIWALKGSQDKSSEMGGQLQTLVEKEKDILCGLPHVRM